MTTQDKNAPGRRTKMTLGYVRGQSFPLAIEWESGVWMACDCAIAWREMKAAAKAAGIDLIPTSGWRSYDEQKALYDERKDPEVRALKGPAARPGFSNHQSGRSVDIRTGLSMAAYKDGRTTATFEWLEANAKKYGFIRDYKPEPWHHTLVQSDRAAR